MVLQLKGISFTCPKKKGVFRGLKIGRELEIKPNPRRCLNWTIENQHQQFNRNDVPQQSTRFNSYNREHRIRPDIFLACAFA